MKKLLSAMSLALLTVLLAVTLVGCSHTGTLKKAYEDAGYTCEVTTETKDDVKVEILTVKSNLGIPLATITYTPDLKKKMGDTAYAAAESSGMVIGNYTYVSLMVVGEVYNIFKDNA